MSFPVGCSLQPDPLNRPPLFTEEGVFFFEFLDFADSLRNLKEFLKIRDESELFGPVREKGSNGIPAIVKEDGTITLNWDAFLT